MEGVAVTRIKEQNFQLLSCYQIANCKEDNTDKDSVVFNNKTLKELLKPLKVREGNGAFSKNIEEQAKDFLLKNLQKAPEIVLWRFKSKREKAYGIAFQKVGVVIFAFLLTPITDAQLKEIESQATGVSYLTGDNADLSITKKDFIQ